MAALTLAPTRDGLLVGMGGDRPVPVADWTSRAASSPGVGTLIRLRDDGGAAEQEDGESLLVAWPSVAGLSSVELSNIGLPDAAPFALEVLSSSIIDDDFEIRYGFIHKGRRVHRAERRGAWLCARGGDYILLEPLYAICEAIDQFNAAGKLDLESRMLRWGRIAEMLPGDAVVANRHLASMRISVASSFRLDPFVNDEGEPDFDPVVGSRRTVETAAGESEQTFAASLPDARQSHFAKRFRGLNSVKHRYAVGGGNYVVLSPEVETALGTVHRAQRGTPAERRDFLRNVAGHLRGAFDRAGSHADDHTDDHAAAAPDDPTARPDPQIDIEDVFWDEGLSERVRGIGLWKEKALPWIKLAKEPWLPPEELGLRVGNQTLRLDPRELPELRAKIAAAIRSGQPAVSRQGVEVPANPDTLAAIEELERRSQSRASARRANDPASTGGQAISSTPGLPPIFGHQVLLIADNLDEVRFSRERRRREPGIADAVPSLRSRLMPHQEEALAWLRGHWDAGNWGALLADDMGLGKTLAALAFLSCVREHARERSLQPRPVLVVAPTGLLRNWRDEHDKHMGGRGLGVPVEAHGPGLRALRRERAAQRGGELAFGQPVLDIDALARADWVLTTYEALRDYQHSFGRVRWRAAVFDEAQKIKNPAIRLTDAALAMDIDFALLMTGTPVENRPADIWSILDRAEPGSFGTLKDFSAKYERESGAASTLDELHRALTEDGAGAPALMLRRLKEDHIPQLPAKRLHRRVVDMPERQAAAYAKAVEDRGRGRSVLEALQRLRSISLHPLPVGAADPDRYVAESARLAETFAILEDVARRGDKALLFVESLEMQSFLIIALRRRFGLAEDVLVINGTVPGRKRKARVDAFQARRGFDVMVLSPRAGGVGLTLTAANHVIHLSRWWNPAVEDQCTDRVFRIGQRRTVHVYLPLARHPRYGDHSFDLKLDGLMEHKRHMNRRVLAPPGATGGDVKDLYRSTMTEAAQRS